MSEAPAVYGQQIEKAIYLIRGQRVMLSTDLARLYQVEPKALIQAVKRNKDRFPPDFAFLLEPQDVASLRSQIVTLDADILATQKPRPKGRGKYAKYSPYAFTEQGVAMLSGVLRSPRAVAVNVAIMRAFVRLREVLSAHKELAVKLVELERKIEGHDESIQTLFGAIHQLMTPPKGPRKQIGFHVREQRAVYGRKNGKARHGIG